ncbi:glycosyltransferase family 4 protein [Azospirillum sp. Vi22]|uniref:glycosyltransferase family protein n=1 Tax=Azospirillum baldaniorum TaxID=1064539 RepID=UPI00157A5467|nr:glycosyltransferase [Azospirillum baldaniorum]NUB05028.1 glycosyltransferase family 4 protein [Azospirillum baldaniorum]
MASEPLLDPDWLARIDDADVVFVAQDGFKLAPARVRAYSFAKLVNQRGLRAEVLSFFDHLGATEQGGLAANLPEEEKLRLNLAAFEVLSRNPRALLYVQKAGYHAVACLMAAGCNGNRIVLDYDDYDLGSQPFRRLEPWLPSLKPEEFLARFAERAKACVASSRRILDLLAPFNPNTHLVHTVADRDVFNPGRRGDVRRRFGDCVNILWCGDVWGDIPMKDIVFGVDAFALVPSRIRRKARFHIIGFGRAWEELKRRLRQRHPEMDNLVFHEHIPPGEFGAVLNEMDIGVLPYADNAFNASKSPTKMFEYMLTKVAICATPVGEAVHCLADGTSILLGEGLEDFSDRLATLIDDDDRRRAVAEAAYERALADYTLEAVGDRLTAIIRQAMAPDASAGPAGMPLEAFMRQALGRRFAMPSREVALARVDLKAAAAAPDLAAVDPRRWSAPLLALLDWPGAARSEGVPEETLARIREAALRHRNARRLRPRLRITAMERPDGPPRLAKLAVSEDWEDPAWFAWAQRFKTNCGTFHVSAADNITDFEALRDDDRLNHVYSYFKRSRGTWERVHLLYGLDRLGLLDGTARMLAISTAIDGFYLALTEWVSHVDVLDIGPGAAARAGRAATGELDTWLLKPRLFHRDRIAIHHGLPGAHFAGPDFAGDRPWDAVLLLQDTIFDPAAGDVLAWADERLADGGILAVMGRMRLDSGTDVAGLGPELAGDGLAALFAQHTGFELLGGFDASLSDATLDRLVRIGAPGAENPHLVALTSDTLHASVVWFCRKAGPTAPGGWAQLAEALRA